MAKKSADAGAEAPELLTLSEVSKRTGISMPTLQKYKKNYQSRIPSVGKGRKQRYPVAALPVFSELKAENLKKRGRPKKKTGAKAASGRASALSADLLSLAEIGRRTKISYPTLLRYVDKFGAEIPHVGKGRKRRYPVEAVEVFQRLRSQSRRGPKQKTTARGERTAAAVDPRLAQRIERIEGIQADLATQLAEIVGLLKQPIHVTIRSE